MLMTVLEKLGYNIRVVRKRKGLTQQQLADQSHISLKHLQLIEKGVKNPSFEILRSLTGVLGLSIDALLNSSDGEDKSADEMRQLYLSCPSGARETLLNATRTLSHELKKLMDKSTDQADSSS